MHSPSALTEHVSLNLARFFCSTLYIANGVKGWLLAHLVADARVEVVAGGDVPGGGDDGEEEGEARHRHVHSQDVRGDLLLNVWTVKNPHNF